MLGLTSRTGTKTTVAALQALGWGWIVGPLDHGGNQMFGLPYALDNGAWPAHQQGVEWNEPAFRRALDRHGPGAIFVVLPDIVMGGLESLRRSVTWLRELEDRPDLRAAKLLIAVQDGMEVPDVSPLLDQRVGLFVGGSSEWKERTLRRWGELASERSCYLHVGRVNSARRLALCAYAGADSFDGLGPAAFPYTLPALDQARRQPDLYAPD
jgi:hypothetical protein